METPGQDIFVWDTQYSAHERRLTSIPCWDCAAMSGCNCPILCYQRCATAIKVGNEAPGMLLCVLTTNNSVAKISTT